MDKKATNILRYAFWIALAAGAVTGGILFGLRDPVLRLLGSSQDTLPYAREYGTVLLLGAPFIVLMAKAATYPVCCVAMFLFGVFRGAYDSNNFAAFFDVVEPRYHASAAGFNLMLAFLIGCLSPVVLGWTKAHYSMSAGLVSLGAVYVVGFAMLMAAMGLFRAARAEGGGQP